MVGTGELKFVHLLCKGDLRQWFEKLGPVVGVLREASVREFVTSFCKSMSLEIPKEEIAEFLENVAEVKFHDFVLLALLISKPLRSTGRLELDEEMAADAEESTSEASDSDEEDGGKSKNNRMSLAMAAAAAGSLAEPPRPTRPRGSSVAQSAQQPQLTRIKSRLRAGSVRKEGVLQYVNFVAKKDTMDWFLQLADSPDDTLPLGLVKPFFESLAVALRLKEWRLALEEALLLAPSVRYPEFVKVFLEMSRPSRECSDLKVDDELLGLDDDSTSEASSSEGEEEAGEAAPKEAGSARVPAAVPAIKALKKTGQSKGRQMFSPREPAWCPPYIEGQSKTIQQLKPELLSAILSYLPIESLSQVCFLCFGVLSHLILFRRAFSSARLGPPLSRSIRLFSTRTPSCITHRPI